MNISRTSRIVSSARIGRATFDDQGLAFFGGYHTCECGQHGKIMLRLDDVREMQRVLIGGDERRDSVGKRMARRLARHYGL